MRSVVSTRNNIVGKLLVTACVLLIGGFAQVQQDLSENHSGEVLADDGTPSLPPDPMETSSVTYMVHTSPADLMDLDVDVGDTSSVPCSHEEVAQSCAGLDTSR